MPSKREGLALLSRDELGSVVDRFELSAANRRKKDDLVGAASVGRLDVNMGAFALVG